jgi:flagellar P-ring protein precursor FlgI
MKLCLVSHFNLFRHLMACVLCVFLMNTAPLSATEESVGAVRIKDLAEIRGVRGNQLVGFGLVVGLQGSGDSKQSLATNKAVANMLTRLGSGVTANEVTTKNVAAVIVTADLLPFARSGDRLDIRVSSVGDAQSLEGGTLVLTPLSGADDLVYALAQGSISSGIPFAGAQGGPGNQSSRNNAPKTVMLSKAATVEREFQSRFVHNGQLELSLRNPDFTTASRVVKAINEFFGEFVAEAKNSGLITVKIPDSTRAGPSFTTVAFVSSLEQIKVTPDSKAMVVVNERTGTIIAGNHVIVDPVMMSHGNLEIIIQERRGFVGNIPLTTTVGELAIALSQLGAGPKDIVAIFQALEAAKALKAELRIL